ncbi:MAG TPA: endonuclease/exonuclease/phosphatase family protein [Blastocatellia bacterium]|jgi:endonuclease/exonuclease/phosphatase family metal-dependent hydrolase|nr:endonuclease/exonuclease/phosphatase family protein [Blastocatellia bacterium]
MWAKILTGALFLLMIGCAIYIDPVRDRSLLGVRDPERARLRLMTWNIGYASLESDSRAHTEDLKAVAETILKNAPDAVALQELTGQEQLDVLIGHLQQRYRGAVSGFGGQDRIEAVLVRQREARFEEIPSGDRYALGGVFRFQKEGPEVVLVSAHADAFNAARRRSFTGDVVDWARARPSDQVVFIAGDFNFELRARSQSNIYTDNIKHDSEAYSYILKYFRDLGRDAGSTAINDRRIDYIFGLPEVTLLQRAEVLKGTAVGRMDHLPLLVEVQL